MTFIRDKNLSQQLAMPWPAYFMTFAIAAAFKSKDLTTQVGAVIVDETTKTVISTGYNGPPRFVDDSQVPITRPEKYDYVMHAEVNAILHAQRNLYGCILYCTLHPCHECMKVIIQAGIKHVVYLMDVKHDEATDPWKKKREIARDLAKYANVSIERFTYYNNVIESLTSYLRVSKGVE